MRKRVLKAAPTEGALSGVIVAALATGRTAPAQEELTLRPVAEEGPGHAVEDFAYPQADKILAEHSLELPAVHGVQTNGYATELSTTVDGEDHRYDVAANSWAAVGVSADPEGREHVLVEIVTSG
ncbi:hypothetical protein [Streptomyces anulatus]|uniref:hypothetical protein n=1 Tax=Streptomyces anulatus TaxID=1892 RepID=UPI003863E107|nr:hypothetical protein OG865_14740 [Streptomyces anulatus]